MKKYVLCQRKIDAGFGENPVAEEKEDSLYPGQGLYEKDNGGTQVYEAEKAEPAGGLDYFLWVNEIDSLAGWQQNLPESQQGLEPGTGELKTDVDGGWRSFAPLWILSGHQGKRIGIW